MLYLVTIIILELELTVVDCLALGTEPTLEMCIFRSSISVSVHSTSCWVQDQDLHNIVSVSSLINNKVFLVSTKNVLQSVM